MRNEDIKFYEPELKIDGTIEQLIDWSYRYDDDYSDEALKFIHEKAKELNLPEEKSEIPALVLKARRRKEGTLPYENMKLDKLIYGKVSFSETMPYGELEIREEDENVLVSIYGVDDEGTFSAANVLTLDEFMNGDGDYLENFIGVVLFYGKTYDEN